MKVSYLFYLSGADAENIEDICKKKWCSKECY